MRSPNGLEVALQLFDLAVAMLRQRLRRERPDISEEEVEAAVAAWLHERPGAPDGDCIGRRVEWPRRP